MKKGGSKMPMHKMPGGKKMSDKDMQKMHKSGKKGKY